MREELQTYIDKIPEVAKAVRLEAVSYTHRDVYKRQASERACRTAARKSFSCSGAPL